MVVDYIRNQEEHHRKFNYQEQFLALLRKHGIGRKSRDSQSSGSEP
jgi:hypothetical protein